MKPLFVGRESLRVSASYAPAFQRMPGAYSVRVVRTCIHAYVLMSVCPSVRDPVRLRPDFTSQLELRLTSSCFILS